MGDNLKQCREYVELIMLHMDGLLSPERTAELDAHLAGCAVCRAELLLQKRLRDALTEEVHPRLSVDFTNVVSQRALDTVKPLRRRLPWLSLAPGVTLLAVTSVLFVTQNDFRAALHGALSPTVGALASAAAGVGQVFSQLLPGHIPAINAGASSGYAAQLGGIAEPAMVAILLALSVLPVIWCFERVGEFLRH